MDPSGCALHKHSSFNTHFLVLIQTGYWIRWTCSLTSYGISYALSIVTLSIHLFIFYSSVEAML